jgi:phage terminase Nu1 subunit (DNA packaging protein)
MPKQKAPEAESDVLKGWQKIAAFLGQPVSVVQRWATEGMPVKREGRYVESSRPELNRWLGRESAGEPVRIAAPKADLSAELKRGLAFVRKHTRAHRKKAA